MTTATSITVRVPLAIRYRPGRKTVVTPMTDGVAPVTTCADPALMKALVRAFRYQRMLVEGQYASISELATAEKLDRGYVGQLLRLTLPRARYRCRHLGCQAGRWYGFAYAAPAHVADLVRPLEVVDMSHEPSEAMDTSTG